MIINETTINCCKPKRFIPFTGEDSKNLSKKPRYKHYEQMSDDVLKMRSVMKAHSDVQNSKKMRAFKAIPTVTTTLLGASIALTQPGKLATKAAAGLGFLALSEVVNFVGDKAVKQINNFKNGDEELNAKKVLSTTAKLAVGIGAIVLGAKAIQKTPLYKTVDKFVKSEAKQLANEINSTKAAEYLENTVKPFTQKYKKALEPIGLVAPFGVIAASSAVQIKLSESLSKDIKEKSIENYSKGKMIQAQARAHFDSIDAEEV